jgi:c-di-GMP-binding flagellar brake protein YcgR
MVVVEKRRARRYDVDISAEVYTAASVLPASTNNLSESGVSLDLSEPLDEEATIGVSLFLVTDGIEDPDAEPLNLQAQVVWCAEREDEGYSAGMRFKEIDDNNEEAIKSFLEKIF